jgi:hypothetical protein
MDEDSDASSVSSEDEDVDEDGLLASLIDRTVLPIYDAAINIIALPVIDRVSQTSFAQWANAILDFVHESATGRGRGGEGSLLLGGSRGRATAPPNPPKVRVRAGDWGGERRGEERGGEKRDNNPNTFLLSQSPNKP